MKQNFLMKYRNTISLILATVIALVIVGASYKSWYDKNINITFNSVNTREVTYKLYYTTDYKDKFSADKFVAKKVKIGNNDVKIILPIEHLSRIRLDLGNRPSVINLSKFKINGKGSVKLENLAENRYENTDGAEIKGDGSITIDSEQSNPYMIVNKVFNIYAGYDINFVKLISFFCTVFIIFYTFFMLALYRKRKKKKEFYDYY
ncbi:MAG: hypothetical protein IJ677_03270 [Alphaproteobacteria bacterium]|nr:hypothetical protein [Alphaproteobacteria bacterium]